MCDHCSDRTLWFNFGKILHTSSSAVPMVTIGSQSMNSKVFLMGEVNEWNYFTKLPGFNRGFFCKMIEIVLLN